MREIGDFLEIEENTPFRVAAYREAARRIENSSEDVADLAALGKLKEIPGVGESIAKKIEEYLKTGHIAYLDKLKQEIPPSVIELLEVPGLGPRRAKQIHFALGVNSIADLEAAVLSQRIRQLPGLGEKSEHKLQRELARLRERNRRLLLGAARPAAEEIVHMLKSDPSVQRIEPAGSIRRWSETIGDIDILVASATPLVVMKAFTTLPVVKEVLSSGPTRSSILTKSNFQIDLRVVPIESYGAALHHFTGSKAHNIVLRDMAIGNGLKVNEYGIFEVASNRRLGGEEEGDVYRLLGLPWIPPELRENRGEIEAALKDKLPRLIELTDIKGDLHVHSNWSDGAATIEEMGEAAIAKGYSYMALTDHSQSLGVANGLSAERVRLQRALIDAFNRKHAPFRILASIELEIRADGSLDFDDQVLQSFDLVTASVHSAFGQPMEMITGRIIRAIQNPYVDVLNHPSGRLLGRRHAYDVDLEEVIRAAALADTTLEINSSPERLDLNDTWCRRAKELGVSLVVNTDAHSPTQLGLIRYGVAVARRGWLERTSVLNTLSLDQLLGRLSRHRTAA